MDIVEQIKDAVAGHKDTINHGVDSVGGAANRATGGQHAARIDQVQNFLKGRVETLSDRSK